MGKFKQLQIEFDDLYYNQGGEPYTEVEDEEELMPEYDSALEDTHNYSEEKPKTTRGCKHKVKIVMGRKTIVTYCDKCGKILCHTKR